MMSAYQIACGAVERKTIRRRWYVELYGEHGVYHVRVLPRPGLPGIPSWQTFNTLKDAQRAFRELD